MSKAKKNEEVDFNVEDDVIDSEELRAEDYNKYRELYKLIAEINQLPNDYHPRKMEALKELMDNKINLYTQKEQFTLLNEDGKPSIFAPVLLSCLSLANTLELESIKFRLQSGREQAKKRGVKMGRKKGSIKTVEQLNKEYPQVIKLLKRGQSIRNTAKICNVSISTVQRIKKTLCI